MLLLERDPQFVRYEFLNKRKHALRPAQQARGFGHRFSNFTGHGIVVGTVHALAASLGLKRVRIAGHDIGLMVAYAYAAQYPAEVDRIALMDAFLPGVGKWESVWLLHDKWHFNFYGETPLKLVAGRERIYFEHFWNDFAANPKMSVSERDRRFYAKSYGRPGAMRAGFEVFRAFEQDGKDFGQLAKTKLPMPMLVLTGEKASGEFLIEQGRLVADNVEGVVVKGAGHWLIDEDGTVYRLVPEELRAFHAGLSFWAGTTDVNSRSVGIELVNPGHDWGYRDFPPAQMEALATLAS